MPGAQRKEKFCVWHTPATFKAQFAVRSNAEPRERVIGGWPSNSKWNLQEGPSISWHTMDCALEDVFEL